MNAYLLSKQNKKSKQVISSTVITNKLTPSKEKLQRKQEFHIIMHFVNNSSEISHVSCRNCITGVSITPLDNLVMN